MTSNASSDFLENSIIHMYLRGQTITASPPKIGLFLFSPGDNAGGDYEVSGTGYSRVTASGTDPLPSVTGGIATPVYSNNWTVASGSAMNNYQIDFPAAGAGGWGTITNIIIASGCPRIAGSSLYFYGDWNIAGMGISQNDIFSIPANGLRIYFQGAMSVYLANNIFNQFLNYQSVYLPLSNVEAALFTRLPDAYGKSGAEVPMYYYGNPTGYQRKNIAGTTMWWYPYANSASTILALDWGTATQDWGLVEGIGIYETVYGNLLFRTYLNNSKEVLAGDTFAFTAGSIKMFLY